MHLEGSCHCGSVRFSVDADSPVPFMRCYCSICRKTAGAGGYAINLGAATQTMKVSGKRHPGIHRDLLCQPRATRLSGDVQKQCCPPQGHGGGAAGFA